VIEKRWQCSTVCLTFVLFLSQVTRGIWGEERREVVEREETGKGKLDKNCLALGAGGDKQSPVLFDGGRTEI
jgi:hypothetical protein